MFFDKSNNFAVVQEQKIRGNKEIHELILLRLWLNIRARSRFGGIKGTDSIWQEPIEANAKKICTRSDIEDQRGNRKASEE